MKGLQSTCLILAVLALSTQSVRHFYVKYFEQTASVLDRYKEDVQKEIEQADSLDELLAKYDPAKTREDQLDNLLKEQEKAKPENEREAFRNEFRKAREKDYGTASKLRFAIQDWEAKSKEIRELRIFWAFGFGLLVLGGIVYLKSRWLGMAFVIPGVVEMIWWTSPSFHLAGAVKEFERLLNNKLVFTNVTLLLLLLAWVVAGYIDGKKSNPGMS